MWTPSTQTIIFVPTLFIFNATSNYPSIHLNLKSKFQNKYPPKKKISFVLIPDISSVVICKVTLVEGDATFFLGGALVV